MLLFCKTEPLLTLDREIPLLVNYPSAAHVLARHETCTRMFTDVLSVRPKKKSGNNSGYSNCIPDYMCVS